MVSTLLVDDSESNQNLYYKTRFLAGDPFIFLEHAGGALLVTSAMEGGRARRESIVEQTRTFDDYGYQELTRTLQDATEAFIEVLRRVLVDLSIGSVVVEATFPVLYADRLRAAGVEVQVEPSLLIHERRQKGPAEVAAIEDAQRATERSMARAIEILQEAEERRGILHFAGIPLTSERLRAEIELTLTHDGFDPGSPIVAGGRGAADPHWIGAGSLKWGEAIVLDIFPRSKTTRYFADMTRTVVKGDPGDALRAMYRATERALDAALSEIRAGANGRDVHAAARAIFDDGGFAGDGPGPRFIHSTGHAVGLDIHERPGLGMLDVELLEGDVLTVEPGLYDPALGGVRIEDLVVVSATGHRNLTQFVRQFEL